MYETLDCCCFDCENEFNLSNQCSKNFSNNDCLLTTSTCDTEFNSSNDINDNSVSNNYNDLITVASFKCISYTQFISGILCLGFYLLLILSGLFCIFYSIYSFLNNRFVAVIVLINLTILSYILPVRPIKKLKRFIRRHIGNYFYEASINFEAIPDVKHPTILCIMPHGCCSFAWAFLYLTDELHHFRFCFSTLLRLSPILRVISSLTGYPSSIRKSELFKHFRNRHSIAMIPGGWHEATIHHDKIDRVYIRHRKGFVKYALQHGYSLTPAFCFGEKSTYSNIQGFYSFRFWLNSRKLMGIIPWGLKYFPIFPRRTSLNVVVGRPIKLEQISQPTASDINKIHQLYIQEIQRIHCMYKTRFYGEDSKNHLLEIW